MDHGVYRVVSNTGKMYCNSNNNTLGKSIAILIAIPFAILDYPFSPKLMLICIFAAMYNFFPKFQVDYGYVILRST